MIISESMRYLESFGARRLNDLSQLKEGELYAIGRGTEFGAFWVPEEKEVERSERMLIIPGTEEYRAKVMDGKIIGERTYRDISVMVRADLDIPFMGVFEPRKGSELRNMLKIKLPELVLV